MADSFDKLTLDIQAEHQRFLNYEKSLKEDVQMGDDANTVLGQLEAHKVSV